MKLMRAMLFRGVGKSLTLENVPCPEVGPNDLLLRVHTCGLCRTDLHIFEGDLKTPKLPLIMGHQIVGTIEKIGSNVKNRKLHTRVGVPWLQKSCNKCSYCLSGKENLCDHPMFTGYHVDGGFAEYCVVDAHAVLSIPDKYDDLHAAPLLCAGLIGYRAYRFAPHPKKIALYGFGSSAHIVTQFAKHHGVEIYAFTRKGDHEGQEFAKNLGAIWSGDSTEKAPSQMDAAIIFAPNGSLVVQALSMVKKGGIVICAGIHMTDIPSFPYHLLWEERKVTSVANLTHKDGEEFMRLISKIDIETNVTSYPLEELNEALTALRSGQHSGSIVIQI